MFGKRGEIMELGDDVCPGSPTTMFITRLVSEPPLF